VQHQRDDVPEKREVTDPGQPARVKSWDGIRGVSILAVFGYHAAVPHMTGGWLGVEVFFVLSGYLITGVLLGEHARTGRVMIDRFWARRLFRLWPALLVMVVVVAPTYSLGPFAWKTFASYAGSAAQVALYVWDVSLSYLGANAGFIGHTWTLGVEMYFYILWPLLLVWLLRRARRHLLAPALIALCGASIVATTVHLGTDPTGQLSYYAPYTQALPLLLGCLLAVGRDDDLVRSLSPKWGSVLATAGIGGLAALIVLSDKLDGPNFFRPLLIASICAGSLLLGIEINPSSLVARLLSVRPLAALGLISYSFYLYQSPIIFGIGSGIHGVLRLPGLLAITTGCATLSYLLVERRFVRLGRRLGDPDRRAHIAKLTAPVRRPAEEPAITP
jgi:peptidoglycan/LPS O-acetylase OafA/YrhL